MNIEEYLIESERTERKFPEGKLLEGQLAGSVFGLLRSIETQGLVLDQFKKVVAYDKPLAEIEEKIGVLMEEGQKSLDEIAEGEIQDIALDQDQIEVLHALLGLVTEMAEIIPILTKYVFVDKDTMDAIHLEEEISDICWYRAILLRKFNISEPDIRQKNIDKLKVRYPEKFSSESALNRNLKAEREVLESERQN